MGFCTQQRAASHSSQTGCSTPFPWGPINCTQVRCFFPQNSICDLVPGLHTSHEDSFTRPVAGISSAVWASQLLCNTWLFMSLGCEIKAYKQCKGAAATARCAAVPAFKPEPAVPLHSPSLSLSDYSLLSYLSSFAFRPPLIPTLLFERLSHEKHWESCWLTERLYLLFEAVYLWLLTLIPLFFQLPDWVSNKVFRAFDLFRQRAI